MKKNIKKPVSISTVTMNVLRTKNDLEKNKTTVEEARAISKMLRVMLRTFDLELKHARTQHAELRRLIATL
jgi:hypothetical protein